MKRALRWLGAAAAALLFSAPAHAPGCGPEFPTTLFSFRTHPFLNSDSIAAGKLGVVWPGWDQRYLIAVYRYLAGIPLTQTEQASFTAHAPDPNDALQTWHQARYAVTGQLEARPANVERSLPTQFQVYLN